MVDSCDGCCLPNHLQVHACARQVAPYRAAKNASHTHTHFWMCLCVLFVLGCWCGCQHNRAASLWACSRMLVCQGGPEEVPLQHGSKGFVGSHLLVGFCWLVYKREPVRVLAQRPHCPCNNGFLSLLV